MRVVWAGVRSTLLAVVFGLVLTEAVAADSYWRTDGGSIVVLSENRRQVEFRFVELSDRGRRNGIAPGTVLFSGERSDNTLTGTGVVFFSAHCRVPYPWQMQIEADGKVITTRVSSTSPNAGDCRPDRPVPTFFTLRRVDGPGVRKPFARSVEIGRSVEVGKSVPIGRGVDIGRSREIGKSVEVGRSVPIGQSAQIGRGVDVGRSVDVGRPVEIGKSTPIGRPVEVGRSTEIGRPTEIGKSATIGRPSEVGSSVPVGRGVETGRSVDVGKSTTLGKTVETGKSVETGRSVDVGGATTIGSSKEIGRTAKTGDGKDIGLAEGERPTSGVLTPHQKTGVYRPIIETTEVERAKQTAALNRAQAERDRLWPKTDIGTGATAAGLNRDKVQYDWETINLGRAAYSNSLQKGDAVFKGRSDWTVADVRKDEKSGFLAYIFLNKEKGSLVIGMQGSADWKKYLTSSDSRTDWDQDIQAYVLNQKPQQFDVAEAYVREVKAKYGDRFTVDCVGHSMGGGACAYAASQVQGVHAVSLDPITHNQLKTANGYNIDNYVLHRDLADFWSRFRERSSPGWYYQVFPPPASPPAGPSGIANSTPATVGKDMSHLSAHSADLLIDNLASQSGLIRPELAKP